jgi:hypothetical protein
MPSTSVAVDSEPGSTRATSLALTSVGVVTALGFGLVTLAALLAELEHAARVATTVMATVARAALFEDRFTAVGRRVVRVGSCERGLRG